MSQGRRTVSATSDKFAQPAHLTRTGADRAVSASSLATVIVQATMR